MRKMILIIGFLGLTEYVLAARSVTDQKMPHQMQHGFVLSQDDRFGSHLVANGHHSRQTEIIGELKIEDLVEKELYISKKAANVDGQVYFLFQAQNLDLPTVTNEQVLTGHIVESTAGNYEPKNIIVKKATFKIERVLLNVENPFFKD